MSAASLPSTRPPPARGEGERSGGRMAFTLLEMLTVVAIIALLLGLLFPAAGLVRRSARRRQAQEQSQALVQAVKQYRIAYGKWPGQTQDAADFVGTNCAALLMDLTNNPRNTPFLGSLDNIVTNNSFLDPWGRAYVIALDESVDCSITSLWCDAFDPPIATNVRDSAAAASWGPDPADPAKREYSWVQK